ncbi:MAG: histidinol dehydrogenase [Alphaproteobacteria bacterium]|jgi:histidinol dehydrogenase
MVVRLNTRDSGFEEAFTSLVTARREQDGDVEADVVGIIKDVRARGDKALIALTSKFDQLDLTAETLAITPDEMTAAEQACPADALAALDRAAARIEDYHQRQVPGDLSYTDGEGVRLGWRWRPIAAVGVYVPGGLAAYPSSVLMNVIPARIAGVSRIVMTVPAPKGKINPLVLAAAKRAGVTEAYRIGGAQAVAALAYGTETIAPVDKITGPGNAWVAAAKRQVFGTVGIDMVAGPSEILVVADGANDADWIAVDLLSQAEHDASAQSILITDDAAFADQVEKAVAARLNTLPRAAIARQSWADFGAIIVVGDLLADSPALIDRLAPEHLELAVAEPEPLAEAVTNAGAIFMGRFTPEAVGDYVAGPNHVLPTNRSARFSSGLGVNDFVKRTTLVACDADALANIGPAAVRLAQAEGLDAHALSIAIRLNLPQGG